MAEKTPRILVVGLAAAAVSAALLLYAHRTGRLRPPPPVPAPPVETPELPPLPGYDSVESLERDHEEAFRLIGYSTAALTGRMIEYFACAALRAGDESVCARIDARAPALDHEDLPPCKKRFRAGRALRWLMSPDADPAPCVAWMHEHDAAESAQVCRRDAPFFQKADLEGYCAADTGPSGRKRCRAENAYILRDPARCPTAGDATAVAAVGVEPCALKARLLKALADKDPAQAAGTPFAPLVSQAPDACQPLADTVLAEYRAAAQAQQTALAAGQKRQLFESGDRGRIEAEKAAREKALAEAKEQESKRLALEKEEQAARDKEEAARRERESLQRELEIKQKFEADKMADELKRKAKGLPMRDKKDDAPSPPSSKPPGSGTR